MNIEILQEVTEWSDPSFNANNGIYWVDKKSGWLIAFKAPGKNKITYSKPLRKFSKSRRKFIKIGTE